MRPSRSRTATSRRNVFAPTSMIATRTALILWGASADAVRPGNTRRTAAIASATLPGSRKPSRSRACVAHQHDLARPAAVALFRAHLQPAPFGVQLPRRGVVSEQDVECALKLLLRACVLDGRDELDAVIEVSRHQVGASQEVGRRIPVVEHEQPAVFEEAAEDASDADRLAQIRNA